MRSHGYVQITDLVHMSASSTAARTHCPPPTASPRTGQALKSEARRRATAHFFFGCIAYARLT
jgi:hypothetical protein